MEKTKIDTLAQRIEQYKQALEPEIMHYIDQHAFYLNLIDKTGFNDPEMDPVLLGAATLARIEIYYSLARKEAYSVSAKCRDLQKFYLAASEQGKANHYEAVRLEGKSGTDAKELSRRIGGRLEEHAAHFEGEYMRWQGVGDSYEALCNGVKDLYRLAEYEYKKELQGV